METFEERGFSGDGEWVSVETKIMKKKKK